MPPEALSEYVYSVASDVWSFGMVRCLSYTLALLKAQDMSQPIDVFCLLINRE